MKTPVFVRELTSEERQQLETGLHSKSAFTLKRCQILLASAQKQTVKQINARLGFAGQTIRHVIHAFNQRGVAALQERSHVPFTVQPVLTAEKRDQLHTILHQCPRTYGKNRSTWTLKLLAEVACEQGLSEQTLSEPTLLDAVRRLGVSWKRAKHFISSPDPAYTRKNRRDRIVRLLAKHPDWQLAFQDEVWWSRLAQPNMSAWSDDKPLRLVEKEADKDDKDRKAICCYGVLLTQGEQANQMLLRFVDGRPVSQVTCEYLAWLAEKMAALGKKVLVLIWDNASWHKSQIVKKWLQEHNRAVKQDGGCRLLVCFLPSKSPWLNNIEPKWVHGKRAVVEPTRTLTAAELIARICDYYQCEYEAHLTQQLC